MAISRSSNRQPDQLRPILCELSTLNRADGSAKWAQDGTAILAAVYGPRQVQQRKEDPERAVVEVVFKPRSGLQGPCDKEYEGVIREALEGVLLLGSFPRTSIMVILQVLSDDGGVLPVALNAACAALVDAGVPMRHMFSAVACGVTDSSSLLVDPDESETATCQQVAVFAFTHKYSAPSGPNQPPACSVDQGALVCHLQATSTAGDTALGISADMLLDTLAIARRRCQQIAEFMRTAFVKALG